MQENIVIGIDSRGAQAGGDQVVRKLSDIKAKADSAGSSMDKMAGNARKVGGASASIGTAATATQRLARSAGDGSRMFGFLRRDIAMTEAALLRADRATASLATGFSSARQAAWAFKSALVGLGVMLVVREFVRATDEMKKMEAQIRLTLRGTTSFAQAWGDVQRIAAATRSDLGATTELYGRIARSQGALGITAKEAAIMTENFAKTLRITGASGQEAAATMRQFSQAISRGQLRGDEFITMMEGNNRFIKLMADNLGIATGEIIEMAKAGKLSGEVIKNALLDPVKATKQLADEMKLIPVSFDDAMTMIRNTSTVTFAAFDRGGEFSKALVDFFMGGVDGVATLEQRFEQLGIRLRSIFDGFATLFDPMQANSATFFDFIHAQVESLHKLIGDLLESVDQFQNFRARVHNNAVIAIYGQHNRPVAEVGTPGRGVLWNENNDSAGQYRQNVADAQSSNFQRVTALNLNNNLPANSTYHYVVKNGIVTTAEGPPGLAATGVDKPYTPAEKDTNKARTNQEAWNDFKRELAARGVLMTPGGDHRTAAEQNAIYRRGDSPLDGYLRPSRHQSWQAFDPLSRTHDEQKVREAAMAAGLKGFKIVDESRGRKHYQWTGHGKPGDMSDALTESERLEEQLTKARLEVEKYQDGLRGANEALELHNEIQARILTGDQTAYEDLSKTLRLEEERQAILQNRQRWGEAWAQLSEAEKANQDAIARSLAQQRMDAQTMAGILARRGAEMEQAKQDAAEIAALRAGDWRMSQQILDDERVRQAIEAERRELMRTNADLSSQHAKNAIAAAGAAEREALARERIKAAHAAYNEAAGATMMGGLDNNRQDLERKLEQYVVAYTERLNDALEKGDLERAEWERQLYAEIIAGAKRDYFKANVAIANHFRDAMLQSVATLANAVAEIFGQKAGGIVGALGNLVTLFKDSKRYGTDELPWDEYRAPGGMSPVADIFSSVNDIMKQLFPEQTAAGGSMHGVSKLLGQAGMGAAIGAQMAPLGHAVFGKKNYSSTGSQIGGSVGFIAGNMILPGIGGFIGAAIGAALGGLVGGLFKDKNSGATAYITDTTSTPDVTGKSRGGPMDTAATSLANAVQQGLQQIATALDAEIGKFGKIAIGVMNGKFTAGGRTFETEKEAVIHAIKLAIQRGAITGLSPASDRVLKGAADPLQVLDAVAAYEQLELALLKLKDPIAGAFKEMVEGFTDLYEMMRKAGYTVEELTKLEELYAEERKRLLEEMTQPYRDFIQQITAGADSGLSVAGRFQNALTDLAKFEADLAAGKTVDQQQFLKTAQLALDLGAQLYGTSTEQYAALRDRLVADMNLAIANIEIQAPEEMLADEIAKAGGETVAAIGTTNNLLTEIRNLLSGGGSGSVSGDASGPDSFVVSS